MGVIQQLRTAHEEASPPRNVLRARQLRREMTDAERRMWRLLREVVPEGRWRSQVPLRHFIVDFASHRVKLVVEVDGGQHSEERDARRTELIEAEGYRMLRFWNNDVLGNAEGCARVLVAVLAERGEAEVSRASGHAPRSRKRQG